MPYRLLCLLFLAAMCASCATLRSDYAIIEPPDLPVLRNALTIEAAQDAVSYKTMDFGQAVIMSAFAGVGLGMYEGRIFYGGKAFPGFHGADMDWYRQPHSGDAWLKLGDSDKVFRTLWTVSSKRAYIRWQRYFAGNFALAYLADFIVSNTVATVIRSYAKHGELRLNIEVSWPDF